MSYLPCADPESDASCPDELEMLILPRTSDLGNFEVSRALPFRNKRMVGPFIFWDQMGPGEFLSGQGIDVLPHPHIGLSTVTYLFGGTLDHKDSLGTDMRIRAGDLNLMSAGSGVVHSERTGVDERQQASNLFGIQSWLAQPKTHENNEATFTHFSKEELPEFHDGPLRGRVIIGSFQGVQSPVQPEWDTLYVDLKLEAGAELSVPKLTEERALYALEGQIEIGGVALDPQQMLVLKPGLDVTVKALSKTRLMLLGGAVMDGPRHIFWNFVSSDKERLEQAKSDWREQNFPKVPGDEQEFVPLPS